MTSSGGLQLSKAIRKCDPNDEDMIVEMAKKFIAYSPYSNVPVTDESLRGLFRNILQHGVVLTNGTGFICGMITPLFFCPSVLIATEMAWWSEGGQGQELRKAFEEWGRANGSHATQFSAFNNQFASSMNVMLTENGYNPVEISYIKAHI